MDSNTDATYDLWYAEFRGPPNVPDPSHCGLCGNRGIIDTRGLRTPAGFSVGGLFYCICLNGRALKDQRADKEGVLGLGHVD
jgi:hypothetical protein